jgi:hypothetical protein
MRFEYSLHAPLRALITEEIGQRIGRPLWLRLAADRNSRLSAHATAGRNVYWV